MAGAARLFPASPKPAGGPVTPAVRSPRVRFARAARDPRFGKIMAQLQQSARKVGQRPSAKRKADEAQAAAKAPPNEKVAGARANQVDDMKDAKVEKPGKGGFLAILRAEIDKVMPKNLDDADKFMKGGESEQIKGSVGKNVSDQKQQASGPTEEATKAPPDTGKVEGKEVAAMPSEPAPAPPPVAGAEAMPAPKPQAAVAKPAADASASADQKLKDAELTEGQLKKANDPRFSTVLTSRDKAKETAAAGPAKYRASETASLSQAKAGALGDANKGLAGLAATKRGNLGKNKTRAQLAKEKEEAERKKVTDTIVGIFDRTKAKVDQKLSTLETDAMAIFDAGADAALATMKSSANAEIDRFKDDRYSGILGKGRWLADLFSDTPPEIKQIIARARERFTVEMDALAVRVAGLVDNRLAEAKAIVAAGQGEVKRYVAGLAPSLRAVGQQAQQDIQAKFDELKQSIDDKAQDLAEKLAEKYKAASEKADAAAKEMEEANKGALRALAEKIAEIAKMLAEFAGRVVSLFKKAAGIVKKIVADPIGFLGNLLSAVKQGISRFVDNIWTHIKRGFMDWLFGALAKGGVQIPDGLPAPGAIVKLVLNVMGLTWANIRPKIVKKIGERAVFVLEKVVEILEKLFTGGVEALWAEMQAFVGNIKAMVLDAILDWVITKVITKAITKIASMFNPAGAIIQAIIMIYDVGSWLATNLPRILDFIESILNSVDRIANGDVGGAAAFIEQSLARMIPILIGFLASLIGLGGLADKVKRFIQKVQAAVGKAVDFVIDKVFAVIRRLVGRGRAGERGEDARGEIVEIPFAMSGTPHTIKVTTGEADDSIMQSSPTKLAKKLAAAAGAPGLPAARKTKITAMATAAAKIVKDKKKPTQKYKGKPALLRADMLVVINMIKDYAATYGAKDLLGVLESEFKEPKAGYHKTLTAIASGETTPDNITRESHHVPPVEFGVTLAQQLSIAATQAASKPATAPAAADLIAVATLLSKYATAGHGDDLPAILIHQQTHKNKVKDKDKRLRVHGGLMRPFIEAIIKAAAIDPADAVRRTDSRISVNPGSTAFMNQMRRIAQAVRGKPGVTKALIEKGKETVTRIFDAVVTQAVGAVTSALGQSLLDGPPGKRTAEVTQLKSKITSRWRNTILKKLLI